MATPESGFDGIADGQEVHAYGTFPWTHDTDSDGVSDYRELFELATNPLSPDSDGDGYSDAEERYSLYSYFTNPSDAASYPASQGARG